MMQDVDRWRQMASARTHRSLDGMVQCAALTPTASLYSLYVLRPLTFARLIPNVVTSRVQLEESECRGRRHRLVRLPGHRSMSPTQAKDDRSRVWRRLQSSRTVRSPVGSSWGVVSEAWFLRLRRMSPVHSMPCFCCLVGVRSTMCSASDRPNVHGCFATLTVCSAWSGASMRSREPLRSGLRTMGRLVKTVGVYHTVQTSRGPPQQNRQEQEGNERRIKTEE